LFSKRSVRRNEGMVHNYPELALYLSWSRTARDIRLSRRTSGHGKRKE